MLKAVIDAAKKAGKILTGETETQALLRRQAEYHRRYRAAPPSERHAIRQEMIADLEATRERLEIDPLVIAMKLKERAAKGLVAPVYVDTSPYDGMDRTKLVAEARRLKVKAKGKNADIAYEIAYEHARRDLAKRLGSTVEIDDAVERVIDTHDNSIKMKTRGVRMPVADKSIGGLPTPPAKPARLAVNRSQRARRKRTPYLLPVSLVVSALIIAGGIAWGLKHSHPRYVGFAGSGSVLDTWSGVVWTLDKTEPIFVPGKVVVKHR